MNARGLEDIKGAYWSFLYSQPPMDYYQHPYFSANDLSMFEFPLAEDEGPRGSAVHATNALAIDAPNVNYFALVEPRHDSSSLNHWEYEYVPENPSWSLRVNLHIASTISGLPSWPDTGHRSEEQRLKHFVVPQTISGYEHMFVDSAAQYVHPSTMSHDITYPDENRVKVR